METRYVPVPIDTRHIELGPELLPLLEYLSQNAHEVWAKQRLDDGWTFGPARSDEALCHPCLIPYAALPEAEKVYDRNAVLTTIKVILALGFKISRADDSL